MANSMLSSKTVLISTAGVVSAAVILKLCAPSISDFLVSDVPSLYSIILSYLRRPPYLYLLLNGIIISIFASSKYQNKPEASQIRNPEAITVPSPPVPDRISVYAYHDSAEIAPAEKGAGSGEEYINDAVGSEFGYESPTIAVDKIVVPTADLPNRTSYDAYNVDSGVSEISTGDVYSYTDPMVDVDGTVEIEKFVVDGGESEAIKPVIAPSVEMMNSVEILNSTSQFRKPPVSRRFTQRKAHHSPEGRTLGVTKPKRHDTLENTWKTITEGRHMPLTRHLKKSDTWERGQKEQDASPPSLLPNKMKKSDTINDSKTSDAEHRKPPVPLARSSGSGKLKKEPSLGQDELNRRVEAFINKFNEEMRLQRQESLNRYLEMLSRGGAH